jgi:hypothetical protein
MHSHDEKRQRQRGITAGGRLRVMAGAELSRRVGKVVGYPPLCEMSGGQRREFHEALLDADDFEDLPGKWQAAVLKAEERAPKLRNVGGD